MKNEDIIKLLKIILEREPNSDTVIIYGRELEAIDAAMEILKKQEADKAKIAEELKEWKPRLIEDIMDLDATIDYVDYILDCLIALKEIQNTGDCNTCKDKWCIYRPKLGETVRYNCMYYEPMEEKK